MQMNTFIKFRFIYNQHEIFRELYTMKPAEVYMWESAQFN